MRVGMNFWNISCVGDCVSREWHPDIRHDRDAQEPQLSAILHHQPTHPPHHYNGRRTDGHTRFHECFNISDSTQAGLWAFSSVSWLRTIFSLRGFENTDILLTTVLEQKLRSLQCSCSGWPTGYGKKRSSNQAQLGQTTCLAVASFLSISCWPSWTRALYCAERW